MNATVPTPEECFEGHGPCQDCVDRQFEMDERADAETAWPVEIGGEA